MPRVKRGVTAHARHKKVLKLAKGYRGKRKNVFKLAKNAVMKAGENAYRDRRLKKRSFHQLWILRINAACRGHELRYSRFIYGLELAGIKTNRKMLAELAVNHEDVFALIVDEVKKVLPAQGEPADLEELRKRFGKKSKPAAKMEYEPKAKEKTEKKADKAEAKKEKVEAKEEPKEEKVEEEKVEE